MSQTTGLEWEASIGIDPDQQQWYLLQPKDIPANHAFGVRVTLGWRRLWVAFEPGNFAKELLSGMSNADEAGRQIFRSVLADCENQGAAINLIINDSPRVYDDEKIWGQNWNRFLLTLNKGQLELGTGEGKADEGIVLYWTRIFASIISAILPIENEISAGEDSLRGYPEGAVSVVQVNRYERDRRNRAAAIAIHGTRCKGCGLSFGDRYGELTEGFIEVHHLTAVAEMGENYIVNPANDLVPLCPNCHAVVHRRAPPLTIQELRSLLSRNRNDNQGNPG